MAFLFAQQVRALNPQTSRNWRKVPRSALIVVVKLNGELADRR
nr:MAG TPA_asm: hypothetical protein [Bacteriophage sp.]